MKAVVLSGGGSKGAYEVGVWKALRQLEYDFQIVTGTSIGSVNGLFMVQNQFYKCHNLWYNLNYKFLYDDNFPETESKLSIYKEYFKNFIEKGGMNTTRMAISLDKIINYRRFKKSKINYGLLTYNLSKRKPETKLKKDLNQKNLKNYILASCTCYPAFQKLEIDGDKYIDGGYYDNVPINLAIEMGATEIIVVNLNTIGITKKVKNTDINIIYIKPRNELGSFLIFDKIAARRGIRLGYNDAMKKFGKLDGNRFTFKYKHLEYNYAFKKDKYINTVNKFINEKKFIIINSKLNYLKDLDKGLNKKMNETIEYLGYLYGFDDSKIYKIYKFNKLLINKLKESDSYSSSYIKVCLQKKRFRSLFDSKAIIRYLYDLIDKNNPKELATMGNIFTKEFKAAIYLHSIGKD